METKDLNSTANGDAKKNDDNKTGKARKVAGMAGGMAATAAAGVAGTMAAQGMNTPEDEWQDDAATASQPAAPAKAEEAVHTETETEEEVFDVNEIRIDVTEEPDVVAGEYDQPEEIAIIDEQPEVIPGEPEQDLTYVPIGSDEIIDNPDDIISGEPDIFDNPEIEIGDIVEVMYGGPGDWEYVEPDIYGGPVDFPYDNPEDYLAGGDIADDLLI